MKLTPQRLFLIIIFLIASAVFWFGTADAAPQTDPPCKLTFDRALALVHDTHYVVDAAVGELAITPTTSGANFYALPRVITVTLFDGEHFAGLLDVRGRGDVLRVRVRDAKDLQFCYSGEIDAATVQGWIAQ